MEAQGAELGWAELGWAAEGAEEGLAAVGMGMEGEEGWTAAVKAAGMVAAAVRAAGMVAVAVEAGAAPLPVSQIPARAPLAAARRQSLAPLSRLALAVQAQVPGRR